MRSTEKTGRKIVSPGWLRTCEVGATLGAPPRENHGDRRDKAAQIFRARQGAKAKAYWRYVEPQTTRHCAKRQAVLARSPPRFSRPRQEPEVPASPGFYSEPCNRASSSALRADIARFFCALRRMGVEGTLGAPPLKPRQEPEVPAPPGFYSEPCSVFSSSALRANIAQFFYALRRIGLR